MTQLPETHESIYKKELEDSRSAILNVLEDYRLGSEDISNSRSAILNVLEDLGVSKSALEQEKARLVSAIDSVSRAFILVDTNGKVILHNNRLSDIFGVEHAAWSLEDIEAAFAGSLDILASYNKCLSEKKILNVKKISLGSKYLEIYLAPVILEATKEEVIGVVITVGDITEEEVLERSKDEFFSIASHELRTPLTAIRGNASMIQSYYSAELLKNPDLKLMIKDIHAGSVRLIELVNDFLDSSRLEQGRIAFHIKDIDLIPVLQSALDDLASIAAEKQLVLKLEAAPGTKLMAHADLNRFKQIIINFIGNALKFTENGGVRLIAYEKDGQVIVDIIDTGGGIAPDKQQLLFQKFQQAGRSTMTGDITRGSGLGLYITRLMAEGMGGNVQLVESALGRGSTFRVTLKSAAAAETNPVAIVK